MNKVFFYSVMLMGASFFTSCGDKDDKEPKVDGKAKMVLALDMSVNGSQLTYLTPVSAEQLQGGTASLANAKEAQQGAYVEAYKNWLFHIPSMNDATLKRYSLQDDGTLLLDGEIICSANASVAVGNILIISDTKGYASVLLDNKIIVFNPSTMQKTGEIDLAKPQFGINGSSTPNPAGMIYRDGKVFVGCMQLTQLPLCSDGAYIIVIDEPTDTPEKMITDMRASSASYFNNEMFRDEKGDIYINCWASYGYVEGQVGGFLRIKKGTTVFDPDYFFQTTMTPVAGIEGGILMSAATSHYKENGIAYMFGTNPHYASNPIDYINDKVIESFKIDLYNKTITKLELPRSNSYSCSINSIGDLIYFGITSTSNGAGLFTYNHKTGAVSSSPVLNAPGTVLDAAVFE